MCYQFDGRFFKAEITPNNNYDPNEIPANPLPKVELQPIDIFESKNWS